jgi:DMSO/TMAO reductase YedYZ molybdopterin-dependent catalytic subunit
MTCECDHGTAPDVAACDAKTHCCGSARVVCQHFCGAKNEKWTGKVVVDASPPPDAPSSLDEQPYDGRGDYDDGDYLQQ